MSENIPDAFDFEGQQVTLAELANIPFESLEAVRRTKFPAGLFRWRIKEAGMAPKNSKNGVKPVVSFKCECVDVYGVSDDKLDATKLVGKFHTESFWITDLLDDLGRVKAFFIDAGFRSTQPTFELVLKDSEEHEFVAPIRVQTDKDDKDKTYSNFDLEKVRPVPENLAAAQQQ